ncbi:spindle pole body formation-associated protein-domain-containing protein [Mariannaea sp. PMI_226]|nr:spindle pole body formation-associated protein-domain-containing protein [Mariannaea sp. PMI_226]
MLGWMLRRGEDAPDADGDADTTQIDQPDTPAPVFAARAFKSALFGTPARTTQMPESGMRSTTDRSLANGDQDSKTPQKPQGILLTPGTGTSRRKRVSFGQDVGKKTGGSLASRATEAQPRQRSHLSSALDRFSQDRKKALVTKVTAQQEKDESSDDEWEEDNGEDNCQDVTVDLNEPHSQSGRYWKEEFQKYHEDAKAEMEKLLKYKQLAKSYAKQKDAEATQLAEMLKEEQQKVIAMEKQIVEGASKMVSKQDDGVSEASPDLLSTLTTQTALAVQYRTRVQELEAQLEEILRDRESDSDAKGRRRRLATSPRTQRTLLETQRELRRARSQVKELGELRDQVSTLKSQLRSAERRAAKAEAQTSLEDDAPPESSRAQELRSQLRDVKEEARKKDDELRQLKQEFDAYREETKAREEDTRGVLERAHNKISELKKEVRTLKASSVESGARPKSWHPQFEVDLLAEDGTTKTDWKPSATGFARRSFDLADLDESVDLMVSANNGRALPEKLESMPLKITQSDVGARSTSTALGDRPDLGRPRWQPFVPRSPRNRDYLGEEIANAIQNGGQNATAMKTKNMEAPDLPTLAKTIAHTTRRRSAEKPDARVDLIQDRFAPVGGPDANASAFLTNNSKSTLPPERRAAAIARIEQRMAEKKRAQRQRGHDKENVRP